MNKYQAGTTTVPPSPLEKQEKQRNTFKTANHPQSPKRKQKGIHK